MKGAVLINVNKDELGEYVWAEEIPDVLHKRIHSEIKRSPIAIIVYYITFLVFLALTVFLTVYVCKNGVKTNIYFTAAGFFILIFILLIAGCNAFFLQAEYRNFKKRKYKCYLLRVNRFINETYLTCKWNQKKKIIYNKNYFHGFDRNMEVIVLKFDDDWYAFDPEFDDNTPLSLQ